MYRLADYFVIVGFDHDRNRGGNSCGKILQRFPRKDWQDSPFIDGIEWFCQPLGWNLSTDRKEPQFFVSVLTDVDANRHYCACFCFNESTTITFTNKDDEDEHFAFKHSASTDINTVPQYHSLMYEPKCLVLVSRVNYPETFRNCLGTIYTVYVENLPYKLENLIGNILGCIQVPQAGGPQVRFSIGAGDKQSLQPPLSQTLPVTGSSVSFLFRQLGIKNVLLLFCAVMTENKILFHSTSYSRLTDSCRALVALMYPFRYGHVYIPILPAPLIEVLSTPTPFIMGVHSMLQHEITDLLDVILVDVDGGSVTIPSSLAPPIPAFSYPLWEATQQSLTLILQPQLAQADLAFPRIVINEERKTEDVIDKELRAIFMRLFAQLLQGYRSCLNVIRIHPKPVITFHKSRFLGSRDLIESEFLSRVLDSMFFTDFVNERGLPWRVIDAWDDLYSCMNDLLKSETHNNFLVVKHIGDLGKILYTNENPNCLGYAEKILRPPDGAYSRIHHPPFANINIELVESIIKDGLTKNLLLSKLHVNINVPKIVPMGPRIPALVESRQTSINTSRRIEVLRTCIGYIFDNKIPDARKIYPAVMRTLEHRDARLTLCRELNNFVSGNKSILDHQQFDLILRLMNKALQNDSSVDENGVAAFILPLSTIVCKKLSTGIIQFAYTLLQDHAVWKNLQFWEGAYYQDVQKQIKALYVPKIKFEEQSALEVTAEQMRQSAIISDEKRKEFIQSEESTLYSQAVHYANRMVSLLIPLEVNSQRKVQQCNYVLEESGSISNSIFESLSPSEHSNEAFESNYNCFEISTSVGKLISRFIDRVCTEGGVTQDHIRNLHALVPGVIHMHIESLEAVYREAKRHPTVQKRKILNPNLLPNEVILSEPLRSYLIGDGRDEDLQTLLPAEGALFLTNYRVIFRGSPSDRLTCERGIIRSFPISSLIKEKRISVNTSQLDQALPEGLQMRSSTFQLLKIAFDAEVTTDNIENFRKIANKVRNPLDEFDHFAFSTQGSSMHTPTINLKERNSTLKEFAKKTLLRTAKKAGFKQKNSSKWKYVLSGAEIAALNDDDISDNENGNTFPRIVSNKEIERLKERSYVKDWQRLGLGSQQTGFRISTINSNYSLCRSYPAVIISPNSITDDNLRHLSRLYKSHRIPIPTWRHRNGAILLRGSIPMPKSVIGILKSHPSTSNVTTDSTGYQECSKYLLNIVDSMPNALETQHVFNLSQSNLSINSLHHNQYAKSSDFLTLSPVVNKRHIKTTALTNLQNEKQDWHSLKPENDDENVFRRVPLYILGEKTQSKSSKLSEIVEFIPVEYSDIRQSKSAYKKLMRACLPSSISMEPDQSYAKILEQSEWLQQIRSILQLSGAVVDLIELQESSVILALEDGWDITSQISSLAQLCLDPFYRTIDGFRVLIEKEWLAFGHKFSHRSTLRPNSSSNYSFAPIFLQFLDAVYQIQRQFPLAFEFNEFYLRFLAYHSVSCRFRTFLFDCELERFDFGITAAEDKQGSINTRHVLKTSRGSDDENSCSTGIRSSPSSNKIGHSIFEYIEQQNSKSSIFFNFMHTPDPDITVLRPQSSIAILELWRFYVSEELGRGPPYDPEIAHLDEISDYTDVLANRLVITEGYDNIEKSHPNVFSLLLDDLSQAESERGLLPQKWRQVWDKLELPHTKNLDRNNSFSSVLVRSHGRLQHKKSTLDILVKGRLAGINSDNFAHSHRFEKHSYTTPTNCCQCEKLLWGPVGYRCMDCGNAYHEKCINFALKNCTKFKAIDGFSSNINSQQGDNSSIASTATTAHNSSHHFYNQFSSNVAENRTHEGYLYKRGALLKGWKQRWFVLDSIKHQLRYYDAVEDSSCKGFIDLADVQSVMLIPPGSGGKRFDEKAFFDLKTSRRTYNFYAINSNVSQEWIEKIQACLQ